MWKGVKRNVERQNNNENQYGRNRRKDKRRKLFFYRAACAMLGLLIVCVIFGAVYFLRESKDPALPSKENTKTSKDYSFLAVGQMQPIPLQLIPERPLRVITACPISRPFKYSWIR